MERGEFPTDLPLDNDFLPTIHPDDISLFIELSQFSLGKGTFAHYLTNSEVVSWTKLFLVIRSIRYCYNNI